MRGLGVPLFAEGRGDMEAECSCGHLRSCRHVAAVLIAAGERLADDPFLLFELRGRGRDDLVGALRERRLAVVAKQEAASRAVVAAGTSTEEALEGVTADAFWRMGAEVRGLPLRVEPPDMSMETLKVLGDLTFAEDEDLLPMLEPIYRHGHRAGSPRWPTRTTRTRRRIDAARAPISITVGRQGAGPLGGLVDGRLVRGLYLALVPGWCSTSGASARGVRFVGGEPHYVVVGRMGSSGTWGGPFRSMTRGAELQRQVDEQQRKSLVGAMLHAFGRDDVAHQGGC